ncbi:MAG: YdcF family protein [Hyphomicrobiales bacterium]|nr:YdcF family protein [Hyphomicrobiales bacterium]
MFFIVSKIFTYVSLLSNIIFFFAASGALLLFTRWWRAGRMFCAGAALLLLIFGLLPGSALLMGPLEERFPPAVAEMAAPDVILVLGGAVDTGMSEKRHMVILNEAAGRMTQALALSRRYPSARLIFTGGNANVIAEGISEAEVARRFFDEAGVPPERVSYEGRSRNTYENATFTRELFPPRAGEHWLLVTSASHMPRAMGVFRHAGFPVVAYPAHYTMEPGTAPFLYVSGGLRLTEGAMREWIGLVAYRLRGYTDVLFPAP